MGVAAPPLIPASLGSLLRSSASSRPETTLRRVNEPCCVPLFRRGMPEWPGREFSAPCAGRRVSEPFDFAKMDLHEAEA